MEMRSKFPLSEHDLIAKGAKLLLTVITKKHRSTVQLVLLIYTLPDDSILSIACSVFRVNMVVIRLNFSTEFSQFWKHPFSTFFWLICRKSCHSNLGEWKVNIFKFWKHWALSIPPSSVWKKISRTCARLEFSDDSEVWIANLGPLYTSPGCFLPWVESPRQVTLLQSNVSKRLHVYMKTVVKPSQPPLPGNPSQDSGWHG